MESWILASAGMTAIGWCYAREEQDPPAAAMIAALAFYLFAGLVILGAVATILSKNPVHSVLWLILSFFNAAGLFVLLGAEFLAMILVIVYVGAVAVLFLFVVMMLDVDFARLRAGFARYLPFGVGLAVVLLGELLAGAGQRSASASAPPRRQPRAGTRRHDQHAGAREPALHALRLHLPGCRHGPA